jgi:hypothetical protein
MSSRAAWRLEAAGFGPVHHYVAGKADWLAADLPFFGHGPAGWDVHPPRRGHDR